MSMQSSLALPVGYQLHDYRINKVLSQGGFGLVYLAHNKKREAFAIKEYLPSALAAREDGAMVLATSADNLIGFRHGMKCFFEEGRALAKIHHPNVVRVVNFFRANDTVYLVMQYERGKTLQNLIQTQRQDLPENFIRRVFSTLLNGLREVHTHKLLHLDIKPANIYIRLDGSPVLLDFGAARQTLSNEKPAPTTMYTPGFAAPEQYSNSTREILGPWSDIYSIGASIFACLANYAPQAADARTMMDKYVSARKIWGAKYTRQLLGIIDQCLRMDHRRRPQSVFALQKTLMDATLPLDSASWLDNLCETWRKLKH